MKNLLNRADLNKRGYEWYVRQPQTLALSEPSLAVAELVASPNYPNISGRIFFQGLTNGTAVLAVVKGLPLYQPAAPGGEPIGPHGFHIHVFGNCCVGDPENPFLAAGEHWNPNQQPHGNHAGDLPVLFSHNGTAILGFITDRFCLRDVIGRSVIIHENPDDYRTQPSGNSGRRIACGVIRKL